MWPKDNIRRIYTRVSGMEQTFHVMVNLASMLDSCKYISLKLASPTVQCRDKFNALTSGTLQKTLCRKC